MIVPLCAECNKEIEHPPELVPYVGPSRYQAAAGAELEPCGVCSTPTRGRMPDPPDEDPPLED